MRAINASRISICGLTAWLRKRHSAHAECAYNTFTQSSVHPTANMARIHGQYDLHSSIRAGGTPPYPPLLSLLKASFFSNTERCANRSCSIEPLLMLLYLVALLLLLLLSSLNTLKKSAASASNGWNASEYSRNHRVKFSLQPLKLDGKSSPAFSTNCVVNKDHKADFFLAS